MSGKWNSGSWLHGRPQTNADISVVSDNLHLLSTFQSSSEPANLSYKSMEAEDIKFCNHVRSDSSGSVYSGSYIEELLHLEITCRELRDERETLQTLLLAERLKKFQTIKDMKGKVDELTKAREKERRHIQNLELELKNLSEQPCHLQKELEVKNIEANSAFDQAQNLETELGYSDKLYEKINHLREELAKSEAVRLALKQELAGKQRSPQQTVDCIRKLEDQIVENSMKFEHEMQIIRQELVKSEERFISAKNASEEEAGELKRKISLVNSLEDQLEMAQQTIVHLQKEGQQFQKELEKEDAKARDFICEVQEYVEQWFSRRNAVEHVNITENDNNFTSLVGNKLLPDMQFSITLRSDEYVQILLSKLLLINNMDEKSIEEAGRMAQQLSQLKATVSELKEELREEKKKANEEAEDLTQEMLELRYQLMEMLEQERELRACTEQRSLDRIEQLETQLEKEKQQRLGAEARCHEAKEQLKFSLDGFKEMKHELRNSQIREAQVQEECGELAAQVNQLNEKLIAAEQKIQVCNEKLDADVIEYEKERSWKKSSTDAAEQRPADQLVHVKQRVAKNTIELSSMQETSVKSSMFSSQSDSHGPGSDEADVTLESQEENFKHEELCSGGEIEVDRSLEGTLYKLHVIEAELDSRKKEIEHLLLIQHKMEQQLLAHLKEIQVKTCLIQELQNTMAEQEKLSHLCEEELRFQRAEHRKALDNVAALESKVQSLQECLISAESNIEELREKIDHAQEAAIYERRKASKFEEEARSKTEKIAMQNEKLVQSQVKYNNLYKKFTYLQSELHKYQKGEKEAFSQIERLKFELSLAKEEVVKSEVRVQKVLKQAKVQLESERRKSEELVNTH